MPTIKSSIEIAAPIEDIYDVIVAFGKYTEFLTEVKSVLVVKQNKSSAEIMLEMELVAVSKQLLKFNLKRPNHVSWQMASGDYFRSNDGSWTLKKLGKKKTFVTYEADVEFGLFVPTHLAVKLIEGHLPNILKSFKYRCES